MARYFFHTEDGHTTRDHEGTQLPDNAAAKQKAVEVLTEMVRERSEELWRDKVFRLMITDGSGLILFALDLSAVEAPAAQSARPASS